MTRLLPPLALILLLAACQTTTAQIEAADPAMQDDAPEDPLVIDLDAVEEQAEAEDPDRPVLTSQCKRELVDPLVGQPETALYDLELPEDIRVIPPGALITQDYLPMRLNIELNIDGNITKVYCG